MLIAALLVIPAVIIEESQLGEPWMLVALVLNWVTWVTFLVEVVVMLSVVPNRGEWLRKHPLDVGIVILTPPFGPPALQAARALRLLRLLRLVKAVQLVRRLFSLEGLRYAAVLAGATVLVGGASFSAVEKEQHMTMWDGVWWAMTTVTTVAYGDVSPKTDAGRGIAIVVMLVGIGFIALLTAASAQRFIPREVKEDVAEIEHKVGGSERREIMRELQEISSRLEAVEGTLQRLRSHDQDNAPQM